MRNAPAGIQPHQSARNLGARAHGTARMAVRDVRDAPQRVVVAHQPAHIIPARDFPAGIGARDGGTAVVSLVVAHQSAHIAACGTHRAARMGARDQAAAAVTFAMPHQAARGSRCRDGHLGADPVDARLAARGFEVADQRTDVLAARHLAAHQAHIAQGGIARMAKQPDLGFARALDEQAMDRMAPAVETAGEGRAIAADRRKARAMVPASRGAGVNRTGQRVMTVGLIPQRLQLLDAMDELEFGVAGMDRDHKRLRCSQRQRQEDINRLQQTHGRLLPGAHDAPVQ